MNYIDIINDDSVLKSLLSDEMKKFVTKEYFIVTETKVYTNGNGKINSLQFFNNEEFEFLFISFLGNEELHITSRLSHVEDENIRKKVDTYIKYMYRKKVLNELL